MQAKFCFTKIIIFTPCCEINKKNLYQQNNSPPLYFIYKLQEWCYYILLISAVLWLSFGGELRMSEQCNYVLAGQPSVSFQKCTGFLITLLIWVRSSEDGETQTGHVCLHRNTCLALIADVSQWTEQKKKENGIKNASITKFLLFTY